MPLTVLEQVSEGTVITGAASPVILSHSRSVSVPVHTLRSWFNRPVCVEHENAVGTVKSRSPLWLMHCKRPRETVVALEVTVEDKVVVAEEVWVFVTVVTSQAWSAPSVRSFTTRSSMLVMFASATLSVAIVMYWPAQPKRVPRSARCPVPKYEKSFTITSSTAATSVQLPTTFNRLSASHCIVGTASRPRFVAQLLSSALRGGIWRLHTPCAAMPRTWAPSRGYAVKRALITVVAVLVSELVMVDDTDMLAVVEALLVAVVEAVAEIDDDAVDVMDVEIVSDPVLVTDEVTVLVAVSDCVVVPVIDTDDDCDEDRLVVADAEAVVVTEVLLVVVAVVLALDEAVLVSDEVTVVDTSKAGTILLCAPSNATFTVDPRKALSKLS